MKVQANKLDILEKDYLAIVRDIDLLLAHKYIYDETIKIITDNKKINISNSFYAVLKHGTLSHLIMGIRRHLKYKEGTISLVGFLNDLIKYEDILNKKSKLINRTKVEADICDIKDISRRVEHIADKYIAHIERKTSNVTEYIEFNEIDKCIKHISKIIRRYKYIFNIMFIPEITIEDQATWKDIFKTPWIEEN